MSVNLTKPVSLRKNLDAGQRAATRVNLRKRVISTVKVGA